LADKLSKESSIIKSLMMRVGMIEEKSVGSSSELQTMVHAAKKQIDELAKLYDLNMTTLTETSTLAHTTSKLLGEAETTLSDVADVSKMCAERIVRIEKKVDGQRGEAERILAKVSDVAKMCAERIVKLEHNVRMKIRMGHFLPFSDGKMEEAAASLPSAVSPPPIVEPFSEASSESVEDDCLMKHQNEVLFIEACRMNKLDVVKLLVEKHGIRADAMESWGLYFPVVTGNVEMVKVLLEHGANPRETPSAPYAYVKNINKTVDVVCEMCSVMIFSTGDQSEEQYDKWIAIFGMLVNAGCFSTDSGGRRSWLFSIERTIRDAILSSKHRSNVIKMIKALPGLFTPLKTVCLQQEYLKEAGLSF
jgi:hypothetical protein